MAREKIHIDLVLNTKGFRPLGRINGQLGEFEKSLDASNARVLAFGASAGAILAVKKAFTATVKAAIEVEKSLKDINVILGATSENLRKFGADLFEIASKTGQAFQVAATAATELARQGLGTEETLKRTRDALILARLAGMDATEAVNALTAAINTFNKAGLDSTAIINKLANVDAAFAVSSDDLAKALGRVGASAQAAGVNFDELLAIVTTVQQKTARGGAVIGNSFKTIFTRVQRPRVIKELENLGIAIRGVSGDVLPAMKVLQNLARQFDNLSQAQRAQVSELIGGVFQVNILKAAMSDLSKETGIYNRALGVSIGSSDQALKRNEELNKTLAAQFQRTVNTFKEGAAELGELTLAPTLERLFGFVDDLSKFSETDMGKVGGAIAKSIFEGIGKFMSGPGLLVIGLVLFKTFSQLGKFAADAFKTLTGLNKNLQVQTNLQRQVFDVLSENPALLKQIKDGTMTVEEAHEAVFKQIQKNTTALDGQLLVSQQLAKSLMGGGVGYSADFGATSGKKSRKFGSSGFMPSFAADRGERLGMMAGGYSGSQIRNPKTRQETIHNGRGGVFNATVNGHESVFTKENRKGKKATFVVPPKNSKAYDDYMSVLSGGFVPSFSDRGSLLHQLKGVKGARGLVGPASAMKKQISSAMNSGVFDDKETTKAFVKEFKGKFSESGAHEAGIRHPGATAYNSAIGAIGGLNRQRSPEARNAEAGAAMSRLGRITPGNIKKARKEIAGEYSTIRKDAGLTKGTKKQTFGSADFSNLADYGSGSNRYTLSVQDGVLRSHNVRQHEYGDAQVGNISIEDHKGKKHLVMEDMGSAGATQFPSNFKGPLMQAANKYRYPTITRSKLTKEQAGMSDVQRFRGRAGGFIPSFNAAKLKEQEEYLEKLRGWEKADSSKRAGLGMPPMSQIKEENLLGIKAGKVFGRTLWTTQSIGGSQGMLAKAQAAHDKFRHDYDVAQGKDVTGQGEPVEISGTKRYGWRGGKRQAKAGVRVYDAKQRFGLLGLYGTKKSNHGYAEASIDSLKEYKKDDVYKHSKNKRIGFKNLQYRSITGELGYDKHQVGRFSKLIREHLGPATQTLTNEFSKQMLGDDAISVGIPKTGARLFPKGAEGEIFETVINALTAKGGNAKTRAKSFEKGLMSDPNKTWDFEETKGPTNIFRDSFNFEDSLLKADAKRSLGDKAGASLVNKIFNTTKDDIKGNFVWRTELDALRRSTIRPGKGKAAGGYIPNFNALFEAVRREKEAGVPAARIRVGRSERLRNGANPSGFGIYNTRDEPMGINQGINNSMAAGMDPKKRGMSNGFIPSYAGGRDSPFYFPESKSSKKEPESTRKNTKAVQKNTANGMKTIGALMLLQQASTGLKNMTGESNNVAQGVITALMGVATALITVKYAIDSLPSKWGKANKLQRKAMSQPGKWSRAQPGFKGSPEKIGGGDRLGRFKEKMGFGRSGRMGRLWAGSEGGPAERRALRRTAGRGIGARVARFKGSGGLKGSLGRGLGAGMAGGFAAIAGLGAAATGVAKVLDDTDLSPTFKEMRLAGKAFEKIKEETEKNIGKLNAFGTSAEQAMTTFNDQNATIGQVISASRKMEKEMVKLPAEMRAKLGGLVDPSKIGAVKDQLIAAEQQTSTEAEQRKTGAGIVRENKTSGITEFVKGWAGISSTWNWAMTGGPFSENSNIKGKTKEELDQDKKDVGRLAERMVTSATVKDPSKLLGMDMNKFLEDLGSADNDDPKALMKAIEQLNLSKADTKILKKAFEEGGKASEMLVAQLAKSAIAQQKDLKLAEVSRKAREDMLKATKAANEAVNDQKRVLENEQKIRKEVIKITKQGANAFLHEVGKINLDEQIKVGEVQEDMAKKMGTATSQVQTAFAESSEALSQGSGVQVGQDIQSLLTRASQGGIISEAETTTQADALDKMIAEMNALPNTLENAESKAQVAGLEKLKDQLLSLNGTQKNALKDARDQTRKITEMAIAQRQVAKQQQRLKSFGGPQALLDPSKLNSPLSQIMAGGKAMASAGRFGSGTGVNRGRINQLEGMQKLFGGKLPAHLQREGVEKATQVGIQQMSVLNKSLGMGLSQQDIRQAASEQAANLFKGDPMKMNTGALETLTKTLNLKNALIMHSRTDQIRIGGMQYQNAQSQMGRYQRFRGGMADFKKGMNSMSEHQQDRFDKIHSSTLAGYTSKDFWNTTGSFAYAGGMGGALYGGLGGSVVPGAGNVVGAGAGFGLGYVGGGLTGMAYGGIRMWQGQHDQQRAIQAGGQRFGGSAADKEAMAQMQRGLSTINVNLGGIGVQGRMTPKEEAEVKRKMEMVMGEAFAVIKARQDAQDATIAGMPGGTSSANRTVRPTNYSMYQY